MRKSILKELIVRHFTYEDLLQGEATLGVVEVLAHHQPSSTANPQLLLVAQCSLVDIQPFFHELEKKTVVIVATATAKYVLQLAGPHGERRSAWTYAERKGRIPK